MQEKLIKDEREQAFLKSKTKKFVQETLTTVMEIIMGKSVNEWNDNEIAAMNPTRSKSFQDKPLFRPNSDGAMIIEYSDGVMLLSNFFASAPYNSFYNYTNGINIANKDNDDFSEKDFKREYDNQCSKERKILDYLRDARNDEVHSIEDGNMGDIYMWIRQIMKYLECFSGYRMQILSEYDKRYGKPSDVKRLDNCYTNASDLKEKCFASKENYKEFRFGVNRYKVARDDKEDFDLLIPDMARNWDNGIKYLKKEKQYKDFISILEEYYDNYDDVMEFEDINMHFQKTSNGSVEELHAYMSLLYYLYPQLSGIYWRGNLYSESYFASLVLQIITRHTERFSLEKKKDVLKRNICFLREWNSLDAEQRKGIGIDIYLLCKYSFLSNYYKAKNDSKGVNYAATFENHILSLVKEGSERIIQKACEQRSKTSDKDSRKTIEDRCKNECINVEYLDEYYDDIIRDTLILTSYMKGKVTYLLPIYNENEAPKVFKTKEEFQSYFIKYIGEEGRTLNEVYDFVEKIQNDNNLKWFIEYKEEYLRRES